MPLNMPTQQSVGRNSHAQSIDDFNRQMRAEPWYQDWFRQQGLDPNRVQLSKGQRQQLEQLILQRGGVPRDAFNDMMIDPAGNLNTEHGFASQPTWLKILEGAGVAAGGYFAAPAVAGALAPNVAAPAAATTAGATGTGSGLAASVGAPAALSSSILSAGGGGSILGTLGSVGGIQQGLNIAGRMAGGAADQRAENRGAQANYNLQSSYPRLSAEQMRTRQLIGADLSENFKPSTDPRAAKFQTGTSSINPATLALIRQRANTALQSGSDVPAMPQGGKGDTLLNILNYAGQGMQAYDYLRGRR